MGSKANIGAAIQGFRQSVRPVMDTYSQAMLKHKLDELERKQRLADELAQKRQTGIDEGLYIPAPRVQVGTNTNPLQLLPGMPSPMVQNQIAPRADVPMSPSYSSTIQPQSTFRLGGEGYMPKPVRTKWEAGSEAEVKGMKTFETDEDIRKAREIAGTKEPIQARKDKRQELVDSTKIREEFINRPEVKEYVTINTQVKSMDSLLKQAKSGNVKNKLALDQALITMYNKLTDPNSVVRESEYARTPENLPLLNRLQGALLKVEQGGAGLTDPDRDALVWGAKVIANERGKTFNETLQSYEDLAGQYGIDTPLITRGLKQHTEYNMGGNKKAPALQKEILSNQQFKIGQTMQKNGITYKYSGNGQWEY